MDPQWPPKVSLEMPGMKPESVYMCLCFCLLSGGGGRAEPMLSFDCLFGQFGPMGSMLIHN